MSKITARGRGIVAATVPAEPASVAGRLRSNVDRATSVDAARSDHAVAVFTTAAAIT
jgi:hypothetical protein